jgi:hypothetical protein
MGRAPHTQFMFGVPEGRNENSRPIYRWEKERQNVSESRRDDGATQASLRDLFVPCRFHPSDESLGYSQGVPTGRGEHSFNLCISITAGTAPRWR